MSERKIIQITATPGPGSGEPDLVYGLCDDGSVWFQINDLTMPERKWMPMPMEFESPVPWDDE